GSCLKAVCQASAVPSEQFRWNGNAFFNHSAQGFMHHSIAAIAKIKEKTKDGDRTPEGKDDGNDGNERADAISPIGHVDIYRVAPADVDSGVVDADRLRIVGRIVLCRSERRSKCGDKEESGEKCLCC